MMKVADVITDLIGNTPLLRVNRYADAEALDTPPIVKLEYFNPAGSVKDRAALKMLNDAEEKGLVCKGTVIIEPTSGNTGDHMWEKLIKKHRNLPRKQKPKIPKKNK